jgi:hypothetical protein
MQKTTSGNFFTTEQGGGDSLPDPVPISHQRFAPAEPNRSLENGGALGVLGLTFEPQFPPLKTGVN